MNLVPVGGLITAVDGYEGDPENADHFADHHTNPTEGFMAWGGAMFNHRTFLLSNTDTNYTRTVL